MMRRLLALLLALTMALALTGCGGKQEQPEDAGTPDGQAEPLVAEQTGGEPALPDWRPKDDVSILVADKAGSLNDITARVLAQYLERYIGRRISVEDIPGGYTETNEAGEVTLEAGAGTAGWMELAARKCDGLTLGYIELPRFSNALYQWPDLCNGDNYTPICTHTTQTAVIVAREGEERFDSLKKMVQYGKMCENPLVAATDGEHGLLHTWTQLFAKDADMPYNANHQSSVTGVLQCLRDGSADFAVVCADDILERDEGLQVLGVFGDKPLPLYPDAPTLSELGLYPYWLGRASCVVAPAGISDDAAAYYEQTFRQAMADKRYLAASSGVTTDYMNAADTQALMHQQQRIALRVSNSLWW